MPTETVPLQNAPLAAWVSVQRRFLRSVNLERDFYSPDPLDGYLLTAGAAAAFERLSAGISEPHARAFSLTGPYGSGKSAFALFASKVMAPASMGAAPLRDRLRNQDPEVGRSLFTHDEQGFWPVLITGTREALAPALRRGLLDALTLLPASGARIVRERLGQECADLLAEAPPSARTVAMLYARAAVFAQEADADCKGLLVVIDEMGKFLEYAAQHPEQGDMQVLQEMAEHAVRSATDSANLVVTVLHQAFEDYGHRLSGIQRSEWQKVQGRFADIAFGDGPEETLRLVAQAIARQSVPDVERRIEDAVTHHMELGSDIRGFLPGSMSAGEFQKILQDTYPLHPLTLRVLPYLFRRFGQNERSLFSFLSSEDPHGFQDFLRQTSLSADTLPLLCVDQLYDYVVHTLGSSLYAHSSAKLWSEAEEALLRVGDRDPLQARIIKVIGLLQILGAQTNLWPGHSLLHFALSDVSPGEVDAAIRALEAGTYITYRRFQDTYRLYEGSDIDVTERLREARLQFSHGTDAIGLAARTQAISPIVARRHSYETGTLRYFDVRPCRFANLETEVRRGAMQGDGLLLLCLVADSVEFGQAEEWLRAQGAASPETIVGLSRETELLQDAALAVECLLWVKNETPELRNDRVAEREVEERLQEATEAFEAEWERLLRPQNTAFGNSVWYYNGERQSVSDYRQLQSLISHACATAYPQTPRLLNELINRRQLSSTAASARRILMEAMIERRHEPRLGIEGFPPEASMYISLLENTGIHRLVTEHHWDFGPPDAQQEPQLAQVWKEIDHLLFDVDLAKRPLTEIYGSLQEPPYGLADGIIPVLLCAILLHNENQVAVYEEGQFVTELNSATFERMIKRPEDYSFQGYRISGERAEVLGRFASGLIRDGSEPTLVNVMRQLYREFNRLPEYTLKTRTLSPNSQALRNIFKEGKEPEQMLFRDLPVLLGVRPFATDQADPDNTEQFFGLWNEAMTGVMNAYPALLSRIEEALLKQFNKENWQLLRLRAEDIQAAVTEPTLKTFILRATEGAVGRNRWLESVAAGIVGRPPRTWGDAEEDRFHNLLSPLASAFQHAELLAFEKQERGAEDTYIGMRVSVTDDDGTEDARVAFLSRADYREVGNISAAIISEIDSLLGQETEEIRVAVVSPIRAGSYQNKPELVSHEQATRHKTVHVLGISGGKDSAALAVYMRDRVADMHYYFCDTGEELPETYDYLGILETYLGKTITRLNPDRRFDHYLKIYNNYLPSPNMRWCTAQLKLKPFEEWLDREFGDSPIKSYVAIRADEDRDGYISHKDNIEAVYPFKEAGIAKDDVGRILDDAGVGLPKYYEWRTRSGCYFCFFQRKAEWAGLKERHPDLYEKAKAYEKVENDPTTGQLKSYTWSQSESLIQLEKPERLAHIKAAHVEALAAEQARNKSKRLADVFEDVLNDDDDTAPCMICNL